MQQFKEVHQPKKKREKEKVRERSNTESTVLAGYGNSCTHTLPTFFYSQQVSDH